MNSQTRNATTNTSETTTNESILSVDSNGIVGFHPGDNLPLNIRINDDWDKLETFITSLDKSLKKLTEQNDSGHTPELISPRVGTENSGHLYLEADLRPDFTKWLADKQHVPFRSVELVMQKIYEDLSGHRRHDIEKFSATVVYGGGYLLLSCPENCTLRPSLHIQVDKGYEVKSEKVYNGIQLLTLLTGLIKIQQIAGEDI